MVRSPQCSATSARGRGERKGEMLVEGGYGSALWVSEMMRIRVLIEDGWDIWAMVEFRDKSRLGGPASLYTELLAAWNEGMRGVVASCGFKLRGGGLGVWGRRVTGQV